MGKKIKAQYVIYHYYPMITEYTKNDLLPILNVINDAALKYKGVIPDSCWEEPYMPKQELINEFDNGVRMFGYEKNNLLVGVMGIQEVEDVVTYDPRVQLDQVEVNEFEHGVTDLFLS